MPKPLVSRCVYLLFCLYTLWATQPRRPRRLDSEGQPICSSEQMMSMWPEDNTPAPVPIPLPMEGWPVIGRLVTLLAADSALLHGAHVLSRMLREHAFEFTLSHEESSEEAWPDPNRSDGSAVLNLQDERWRRAFRTDAACMQGAVAVALGQPVPPVQLVSGRLDDTSVAQHSGALSDQYHSQFMQAQEALPAHVLQQRAQHVRHVQEERNAQQAALWNTDVPPSRGASAATVERAAAEPALPLTDPAWIAACEVPILSLPLPKLPLPHAHDPMLMPPPPRRSADRSKRAPAHSLHTHNERWSLVPSYEQACIAASAIASRAPPAAPALAAAPAISEDTVTGDASPSFPLLVSPCLTSATPRHPGGAAAAAPPSPLVLPSRTPSSSGGSGGGMNMGMGMGLGMGMLLPRASAPTLADQLAALSSADADSRWFTLSEDYHHARQLLGMGVDTSRPLGMDPPDERAEARAEGGAGVGAEAEDLPWQLKADMLRRDRACELEEEGANEDAAKGYDAVHALARSLPLVQPLPPDIPLADGVARLIEDHERARRSAAAPFTSSSSLMKQRNNMRSGAGARNAQAPTGQGNLAASAPSAQADAVASILHVAPPTPLIENSYIFDEKAKELEKGWEGNTWVEARGSPVPAAAGTEGEQADAAAAHTHDTDELMSHAEERTDRGHDEAVQLQMFGLGWADHSNAILRTPQLQGASTPLQRAMSGFALDPAAAAAVASVGTPAIPAPTSMDETGYDGAAAAAAAPAAMKLSKKQEAAQRAKAKRLATKQARTAAAAAGVEDEHKDGGGGAAASVSRPPRSRKRSVAAAPPPLPLPLNEDEQLLADLQMALDPVVATQPIQPLAEEAEGDESDDDDEEAEEAAESKEHEEEEAKMPPPPPPPPRANKSTSKPPDTRAARAPTGVLGKRKDASARATEPPKPRRGAPPKVARPPPSSAAQHIANAAVFDILGGVDMVPVGISAPPPPPPPPSPPMTSNQTDRRGATQARGANRAAAAAAGMDDDHGAHAQAPAKKKQRRAATKPSSSGAASAAAVAAGGASVSHLLPSTHSPSLQSEAASEFGLSTLDLDLDSATYEDHEVDQQRAVNNGMGGDDTAAAATTAAAAAAAGGKQKPTQQQKPRGRPRKSPAAPSAPKQPRKPRQKKADLAAAAAAAASSSASLPPPRAALTPSEVMAAAAAVAGRNDFTDVSGLLAEMDAVVPPSDIAPGSNT